MNEQDPKLLEEQFYSRPYYLSYSALNKLLYSPSQFYEWYILKQQEDKLDTHLVEGRATHCLLLQKEKFDEEFVITLSDLPSDNSRRVIDQMYLIYQDKLSKGEPVKDKGLDFFKEDIIEFLKAINLHQALKTDQQRWEKIIIPSHSEYFEYLKSKGSKALIDQESVDKCKGTVEIVKADPKIMEKLRLVPVSDFDQFEVFSELFLKVDPDESGFKFGLKGIIDRLVIDHEMKKIIVSDFKGTNKRLQDFRDTIEFWNYWVQMAIYNILVKEYVKDTKAADYQIECNFIVADVNKLVYPFTVSQETLSHWANRLVEKLKEFDYHYKNRSYKLPYIFETGSVIL